MSATSKKEWLETVPTGVPLRPPFAAHSIDVQVGGNISRGPDHSIVGVEIVIHLDGGPISRTGMLTASQARALAQDLLTKADDADRQTWFD